VALSHALPPKLADSARDCIANPPDAKRRAQDSPANDEFMREFFAALGGQALPMLRCRVIPATMAPAE